jgi:tripartite-type tricarboxylate transporter receptor subunit TctC
MIGPKITEMLGQPVIVENISGGSGQVGLGVLAKAPADGYTIAAGQGGNLTVLPHTFKKVPYNVLKDFTGVSLHMTNYQGIAANINAPFNNLTEMISYAKANPGMLSVATNGDGGYPHLTFEDLRMRADFKYLPVPYKGSIQVVTDLVGGQVQASILGIASFTPNIKAGKIKLIGISTPSRVKDWPNTQSTSEVVPGFSAVGWFGYIAPAGTPPEIVQILNSAINKAMNSPDVTERVNGLSMAVVNESPEYFNKIIKDDYIRYGKIVKDINFQPQ